MYLRPRAFANLELTIKLMSECFPISRGSGGQSGKRLAKTQIALPCLIAVLDGKVCLGEGVCKAVQTRPTLCILHDQMDQVYMGFAPRLPSPQGYGKI